MTKTTRRKPLAPGVRLAVFRADGFRCVYCGRGRNDGAILCVDHKVPVAKGGTNDFNNLVTACSLCNWGKGDSEVPVQVGCRHPAPWQWAAGTLVCGSCQVPITGASA